MDGVVAARQASLAVGCVTQAASPHVDLRMWACHPWGAASRGPEGGLCDRSSPYVGLRMWAVSPTKSVLSDTQGAKDHAGATQGA